MTDLGKLRLGTGRPWTRAELDAHMAGPQGEQLIDRLRQVLDYFQPKWYWIESPWLSRMRDYITDLSHVCVGYSQYSDWGCRKRTGLWTNIPLAPRACDGHCANMDGSKHRANLINRSGYLHEKYRVTSQLIEELLGPPRPLLAKLRKDNALISGMTSARAITPDISPCLFPSQVAVLPETLSPVIIWLPLRASARSSMPSA
jgi:hypothetical protein